MWDAMARQRNSYLHRILKTKHIKPNSINNCVETDMAKRMNIDGELIPNFCNPTLVEPQTCRVKIFKDKATIAYGLDGVPKLIKEICSPDATIQSQALQSLCEELLDPQKYYRAIKDFVIVNKINRAMDKLYPHASKGPSSLELLVTLIGILASHLEGAQELIKEQHLINCLYSMIVDDGCVSRLAAKALMMMSSQPEVADLMVTGDHIQRILYALHVVEIIPEVYEELANLIERSPEKALCEGCFGYLYPRIKCRDEMQPYIVKCFAILVNSNDTQESCDRVDAVATLYMLLSDDTMPLMTREYLCLALMGVLYSTRAMWRCREFWDLPIILIKNAHNKESAQMQQWSLQALRQLTMMPSIKNFVRKTCKRKVKNISCFNKSAEELKNNLLTWLRKKTYVLPDSDTNETIDSESDEGELIVRGEALPIEKYDEAEENEDMLPMIPYRLDYPPAPSVKQEEKPPTWPMRRQ